jgi:hypothetical protein
VVGTGFGFRRVRFSFFGFDYVRICYYSNFENVLLLWKQSLLTEIILPNPELVRKILIRYFETLSSFNAEE